MLVWRDGRSHITFAATKSRDEITIKESIDQSAELIDEPQTGSTQDLKSKEGIGFEYSDDEDGSEAGAEANEAKVVTDDTMLMAPPEYQYVNAEDEKNDLTVSEKDGDASVKTPEESNQVFSDPSPYLYIPSSPPISIAGGPHHPFSTGTSSPSLPLLPTLPNEMPRAETTQISSSSSSPLSRKRKALSSKVNKKEEISSSGEEQGEEEYSDPPVKRKRRKNPSYSTSSSQPTAPTGAKLHTSRAALVPPLAH
jgi:hypothetical protein